jgi:hypothetical protein
MVQRTLWPYCRPIDSTSGADLAARRVTFRHALADRRFRALWVAQILSLAGDQLARVALAVLVFHQTGSAGLTALVYALSFAPAVLGGVLLSGLADRMSRTRLMIACDLVRAALVAVMAIPSVSLPFMCVLLALVVIAGQPFLAAEIALLPSLLTGERYLVASGLRMITNQTAQLAGFAGGGVAVAVIGARGSLAVDAATFVISAVIIRRRVHVREGHGAAMPSRTGFSARQKRSLSDARAAGSIIWGDRRLRLLAAIGWLAAFHIVPEALAAPYAAGFGGGARSVGLLMAAPPAGTALGALALLRVPPSRRPALLGPLAVLTAVPMIACITQPGLGLSLLAWVFLGFFSAYQLQAAASFIQQVPDERRGQVMGLVGSALIAFQGLGVLAFGLLAQRVSAATTIAVAGCGGTVLALGLAVALRHTPTAGVRACRDALASETDA